MKRGQIGRQTDRNRRALGGGTDRVVHRHATRRDRQTTGTGIERQSDTQTRWTDGQTDQQIKTGAKTD